MKALMLAVVLAAAVAIETANSAQSAARVISNVTYSPRPLSDQDDALTVTFTANRPARRGYEYGVTFYSLNESAPRPCAWAGYSWNREYGGDPNRHLRAAGRYRLVIRGRYFGAPQPFCRGRSAIEVVERKVGTERARNLGPGSILYFRVIDS